MINAPKFCIRENDFVGSTPHFDAGTAASFCWNLPGRDRTMGAPVDTISNMIKDTTQTVAGLSNIAHLSAANNRFRLRKFC